MSAGVPLAWLQLMGEKRRLMAAVAGIVFAVVLMLLQLGFEDALLSSAGLLHSRLDGDLVLISSKYQFVISPRSFTERHLYQALGVEGVESVSSVYLGQLPFKNPVNRTERVIFAIGFKPVRAILETPGIRENLEKLRTPDTVLFDSIRRPEFGPVAEMLNRGEKVTTEAGGRRVEVVGLFQLGTSFGVDGNLVMSEETFFRLFPRREPGLADVGLIHLKPGVDPGRARAQIEALLSPEVRVLTHTDFVNLERRYWTTNTPVGFVFKLGVLMGLFVGCIIVYQILYTDVTDHLPEYATLKAMGYPDRYLFWVVIQESLVLSVFGFVPGLLVSFLVYKVSRDATLLPVHMTLGRTVVVYLLTLLMCAASGALAVRKLRTADPAAIF